MRSPDSIFHTGQLLVYFVNLRWIHLFHLTVEVDDFIDGPLELLSHQRKLVGSSDRLPCFITHLVQYVTRQIWFPIDTDPFLDF